MLLFNIELQLEKRNKPMFNLTPLARCLVDHHLLEEAVLLDATQKIRVNKKDLLSYLIEEKLINATHTAKALSETFGLPLLDLDRFEKGTMPFSLINEKIIVSHQILPLIKREDTLFVAFFDPTQTNKINEIRFHTDLTIIPVLVEADKLTKTIDDLLNGKIVIAQTETPTFETSDLAQLEVDVESNVLDELASSDAPLVRFIDKIILDGVNTKASDIHFEPYENIFRIRYRRDGILYEVNKLPIALATRFVARLKVMSQVDISDRRIPQDGRFKMQLSDRQAIGFRINTCPTLFGEKVVLRILDPSIAKIGIDSLGMFPAQKKLFEDAFSRPQGMILVTGPTGSGKTITQYTALNIINQPELNISTVEDPIEIYLMGINQVNINTKTGLTFASALRSFLRQDPDVIMVGEIRDTETGEIAVKAAQTGHLVLSTLHTNSAAESLTRLATMGIESFNIASAVKLVIAQRLARRLCENCKHIVDVSKEILLGTGFTEEEIVGLQIFGPTGCPQCSKGYKGRVGIFEMLPVTRKIEQLILENANSLQIMRAAEEEGMMSLRRSGLQKVMLGLTSLEELNNAIMS
jgi:type IV pilus assembly protein PilB